MIKRDNGAKMVETKVIEQTLTKFLITILPEEAKCNISLMMRLFICRFGERAREGLGVAAVP